MPPSVRGALHKDTSRATLTVQKSSRQHDYSLCLKDGGLVGRYMRRWTHVELFISFVSPCKDHISTAPRMNRASGESLLELFPCVCGRDSLLLKRRLYLHVQFYESVPRWNLPGDKAGPTSRLACVSTSGSRGRGNGTWSLVNVRFDHHIIQKVSRVYTEGSHGSSTSIIACRTWPSDSDAGVSDLSSI